MAEKVKTWPHSHSVRAMRRGSFHVQLGVVSIYERSREPVRWNFDEFRRVVCVLSRMDRADAVSHHPMCKTQRPGFRLDLAAGDQCDCDFVARLRRRLGM